MRDLMSSNVDMQIYGSVLQRFFHFYTAMEAKLMPALNGLRVTMPQNEYQYVPRSPLLCQDLIDLKFSTRRPTDWDTLPMLVDSFGAALGVLYVLEGSTQGGRVIAPFLKQSLGVTADRGGRFFSLHIGTNSGWLGFRRLLNAIEADPSYIDPAVNSARNTFEDLGSHLDLDTRCHREDWPL